MKHQSIIVGLACQPLLTTDGYISACDTALFGNLHATEGHMPPFIFGKWDADAKKIVYFQERIDNMRRRKAENMPGSVACPALNRCAGYCLVEVATESGNMFGKISVVCNYIVHLCNARGDDLLKYEFFHP